MKRLGVLTAGGDCPGLNSALFQLSKRCAARSIPLLGFMRGWHGLLENKNTSLTPHLLRPYVNQGGTFLGSSKTFPLESKDGVEKIKKNLFLNKLDALIVIGGESSLSVCSILQKKIRFPFFGIPKTIDNDVRGTDHCIGFSTAVETVKNYIQKLASTAQSHDRLFIVETMGRFTGWLAYHGGLSAHADLIYIPEQHLTLEKILADVKKLKSKKEFGLLVVAEGVSLTTKKAAYQKNPSQGVTSFGGIAHQLKAALDPLFPWDTRAQVIGHIQRGGEPNAFDQTLSISFANAVFDGFLKGKKGLMVVHHQNKIKLVPLPKPHTPAFSMPMDLVKTLQND